MRLYSRYLGGKNLNETIQTAKQFNSNGIKTSLSYLPVVERKKKDVNLEVTHYKKILNEIKKNKLDSDVTIKTPQFGYYIDKKLSDKKIEEVVKEAKKLNLNVWIDMEMEDTVDDTISLFKKMHKKYGNVGICIQAYLKRSEKDIKDLVKTKNVMIRLVKGFYKDMEFDKWEDVTKNYRKLMRFLLKNCKRPCIATHDLDLIEEATKIIKKNKIKNAEIQHFKGVRDVFAESEVKNGITVRMYIPFGNVWGYFSEVFNFDMKHQLQRVLGFKKITG